MADIFYYFGLQLADKDYVSLDDTILVGEPYLLYEIAIIYTRVIVLNFCKYKCKLQM